MAIINVPPPLVFTFGMLGNIISILVYLAPVPTFYRIYKKKSTEDFQSLPYVVALFSSSLWLYYSLIKQNAPLLTTINSVGCVIETIYIFMYIFYASRDKRIITVKLLLSMNILLLSSIILLTQFLAKRPARISVIGWICVAFSISVFAAPLTIVSQVIKTKSVEFMPFPLSFFLTLSAVMWFCYGLFLGDICVALPNILGFLLGMIQMVLFAFFRNKSTALPKGSKQTDDNLKSIVILSALGPAEVYPVDVKPEQIEGSQDETSCEATQNLGP